MQSRVKVKYFPPNSYFSREMHQSSEVQLFPAKIMVEVGFALCHVYIFCFTFIFGMCVARKCDGMTMYVRLRSCMYACTYVHTYVCCDCLCTNRILCCVCVCGVCIYVRVLSHIMFECVKSHDRYISVRSCMCVCVCVCVCMLQRDRTSVRSIRMSIYLYAHVYVPVYALCTYIYSLKESVLMYRMRNNKAFCMFHFCSKIS